MSIRPLLLAAAIVSSLAALGGCDQLGIESASVTAARVEADGKAVGAACRHAGQAIEDCFALNKRVDKAAIYAGWRDMDDYMRENKIEAVAPTLGPDGRPRDTTTADAGDGSSDGGGDAASKVAAGKPSKGDKLARTDKPADKGADKAADKAADKGPEKTASADGDKSVSAH